MNSKFMKKVFEYTYLFVIGCIAGYLFEVAFYFLKHGIFFNKKGLVFGTFKPLYGFGMIIMNILLNPVKNKGFFTKYVFGCIIGTVFEYVASLILEYSLGISSWDYSKFRYSLGGRIYIPYCFFWGFLAIAWIDYGYPFIIRQLDRINRKVYNILAIFLIIFMTFNFSLTVIICDRVSERARKEPAVNIFDKFVDKYYPKDVVKKKLPQLTVIKK